MKHKRPYPCRDIVQFERDVKDSGIPITKSEAIKRYNKFKEVYKMSVKTYKNSGDPVERKDCQGLRLQTVKSGGQIVSGLVIDQHGRVFENTKEFKSVGCGYASH